MQFSVIKIERHLNDNNCYTVKLKIKPSTWQKLLGDKCRTQSFVGHKNNWYDFYTMLPAPKPVRKFLTELFFSGEFRHLLAKIKLESAQKAPPQRKKTP